MRKMGEMNSRMEPHTCVTHKFITYQLTPWLTCTFGCTQITCKDTLPFGENKYLLRMSWLYICYKTTVIKHDIC